MKVIVYSAPWCPWCQKTKEFLKEHNIEFEEKDVQDHNNAHEAMDVSGQAGIPVTVIDGQVVIGFDIAKLKELLKLE
jgi:glutaredoxin-like YruB-family protein